MKRLKLSTLICTLAILSACVTTTEFKQANDLIRSDNTLMYLLNNGSPEPDQKSELFFLATHAKQQGDSLKSSDKPTSIAYYRIATSAYWKSGESIEAPDAFIDAAESGNDLCNDIESNANSFSPDRDCFFLALVVPYAVVEALLNNTVLSQLLELDPITAANASEATDILSKSYSILAKSHAAVNEVIAAGSTKSDLLLGSSSLNQYYCGGSKEAFSDHRSLARKLERHVSEYTTLSDALPALTFTEAQVKRLTFSNPSKNTFAKNVEACK